MIHISLSVWEAVEPFLPTGNLMHSPCKKAESSREWHSQASGS